MNTVVILSKPARLKKLFWENTLDICYMPIVESSCLRQQLFFPNVELCCEALHPEAHQVTLCASEK